MSIVVGVECNRSFRIWHCEIRDYDRRRAFDRKQFGHQASLLAHGANILSIINNHNNNEKEGEMNKKLPVTISMVLISSAGSPT